jgi:AAA+ superfamily predicted ATPase
MDDGFDAPADANPPLPDTDDALAAVMLDGSRLSVDEIRRGAYVTLLRVPEGSYGLISDFLRQRVLGCLETVVDPSPWSIKPDVKFVVGNSCEKPLDWLNKAIRMGAGVVAIVEGDAVVHDTIMRFVDREGAVSAPGKDVFERVIDLATGQSVRVPDESFSVDDIMYVVRTGADVATMDERIIRIVSDREQVDIESEAAKVVTKLSDLSGYGDAKLWGMQLAADLRDHTAGMIDWDEIDRGILLSGPPGCGKTYFASALAAECGIELISGSYSDFESQTPSGNLIAKTIKKLFDNARKKAPCIVFIDELDSIGSRSNVDHNSSWFNVVINALLAELDGMNSRDGVIVIGATNHPDRIDPAILRPGRLERHVAIPAPTIKDLEGVIKHHMPADCDLSDLTAAARACRGRTPADIAMIVRDAKRSARWCKRQVCADDVAMIARMQRQPTPHDRLVCIHESGHALAAIRYGIDLVAVDADAGHNETTVPGIATPREMEAYIRVLLAGRAAEEVVFDTPSTSAISDLEEATKFSLSYHGRFGFGASGLSSLGEKSDLLPDVRRAAAEMLNREYEAVKADISRELTVLKRLATRLRRDRYLDGAEVARIVAPSIFERRRHDESASWTEPSDDERSPPGNKWKSAA